ncbi:MAG: hypothetical protein AAF657_21390, partial [Acidobacteriota bacterium]
FFIWRRTRQLVAGFDTRCHVMHALSNRLDNCTEIEWSIDVSPSPDVFLIHSLKRMAKPCFFHQIKIQAAVFP